MDNIEYDEKLREVVQEYKNGNHEVEDIALDAAAALVRDFQVGAYLVSVHGHVKNDVAAQIVADDLVTVWYSL